MLFLLWLSVFILSGAISLLFPSSIFDTYWFGGGSWAYFPVSYIFSFSYCSWCSLHSICYWPKIKGLSDISPARMDLRSAERIAIQNLQAYWITSMSPMIREEVAFIRWQRKLGGKAAVNKDNMTSLAEFLPGKKGSLFFLFSSDIFRRHESAPFWSPHCTLLSIGKDTTCQCWRCKGCGLNPWVRKFLCRRKQQPTPVFMENLMDRGAWWATVHGVTKSQIWLKQLSTVIAQSVH